MAETTLSDADLDAIQRRLDEAKYQAACLRPPPPLTGMDKEIHDIQEAKWRARQDAAKAEDERQRAVREAVEARKRAEWDANEPARAAAAEELAKLEPMLAAAEKRVDELLDRQIELERVMKR